MSPLTYYAIAANPSGRGTDLLRATVVPGKRSTGEVVTTHPTEKAARADMTRRNEALHAARFANDPDRRP